MFQELNNQFQKLMSGVYQSEPTYYGYSTNNKHPEFPPLMNDGRSLVSNWQPESHLNDRLVKQNNIKLHFY